MHSVVSFNRLFAVVPLTIQKGRNISMIFVFKISCLISVSRISFALFNIEASKIVLDFSYSLLCIRLRSNYLHFLIAIRRFHITVWSQLQKAKIRMAEQFYKSPVPAALHMLYRRVRYYVPRTHENQHI